MTNCCNKCVRVDGLSADEKPIYSCNNRACICHQSVQVEWREKLKSVTGAIREHKPVREFIESLLESLIEEMFDQFPIDEYAEVDIDQAVKFKQRLTLKYLGRPHGK